jgi:hypothetical protein
MHLAISNQGRLERSCACLHSGLSEWISGSHPTGGRWDIWLLGELRALIEGRGYFERRFSAEVSLPHPQTICGKRATVLRPTMLSTSSAFYRMGLSPVLDFGRRSEEPAQKVPQSVDAATRAHSSQSPNCLQAEMTIGVCHVWASP